MEKINKKFEIIGHADQTHYFRVEIEANSEEEAKEKFKADDYEEMDWEEEPYNFWEQPEFIVDGVSEAE